ncbi:hypothetical protein [Ammoniphilus sp. 3BR4]|uniref:hypothetical protein n=1 Tax=Ammoniphilus sp. 3BR4 TaxID=3158265 RepID=UPI0034666D28
MNIRKGLKWVLAAVLLWILAKVGMAIFGVFHSAHYMPHPMGFGFGGHGMRGHHHMEAFHFFWPVVSAVFWIAVIVVLVGWVIKKMNTHRVSHSMPGFTSTYSSHPPYKVEADFLDEWEKNQTKQKEKE